MPVFYLLVVAVIAFGALNRVELGLQTYDSQIARGLAALFGEAATQGLRQWLDSSPLISRELQKITPKDGLGYWFGIVGSVTMLLLILYRSRKRRPAMRNLGSTASWFRWHEVLGILGPLLILFHCNFQLHTGNGLRDITSIAALVTMLIVTCSGLIARYAYANSQKGRLYGLWQFLHLPLFIITVITGLVHVVAVHLY